MSLETFSGAKRGQRNCFGMYHKSAILPEDLSQPHLYPLSKYIETVEVFALLIIFISLCLLLLKCSMKNSLGKQWYKYMRTHAIWASYIRTVSIWFECSQEHVSRWGGCPDPVDWKFTGIERCSLGQVLKRLKVVNNDFLPNFKLGGFGLDQSLFCLNSTYRLANLFKERLTFF